VVPKQHRNNADGNGALIIISNVSGVSGSMVKS
jgi:hypothetical protein